MSTKFDGIPVVTYTGAFSGKFDMEEHAGEGVAFDDVVCFLVIGTASKSGIDADKSGDLRRTNTFAVNDVKILDLDFAKNILDSLENFDGSTHRPDLEVVQDFPMVSLFPPRSDLASSFDEEDVHIAPQVVSEPIVKDATLAKFLES